MSGLAPAFVVALGELDAALERLVMARAHELDPLRGMRVTQQEVLELLASRAQVEPRAESNAGLVKALSSWLDPEKSARLGLSALDAAALLLAMAPELDAAYERVYGFLQDDLSLSRPRLALISAVCGLDRSEHLAMLGRLMPGAPLRRWRLLVVEPDEHAPLATCTLRVSRALLASVLDDVAASLSSTPNVKWIEPDAATAPPDWEPEADPRQRARWYYTADEDVLAAVPLGVATRARRPALLVELAQLRGDSRLIGELAHQAVLTEASVVVDARGSTDSDAAFIGALLEQTAGCRVSISFVSGARPPRRLELELEASPLGVPAPVERTGHWLTELFPAGASGVEHELCERLAHYVPLARTGVRAAVQQCRADGSAATDEVALLAAARAEYESPSELGHHVPLRLRLSDLHFSEKTGRELAELGRKIRVHEAARRASTLAGGLVALFTGPSGTGKSAAAEALALETGRDLFRIDASQTLDRYVGGTEKQIDRAFSLVEGGRLLAPETILLIDEADWLFASRVEGKDSHDHYLNVRVSHLLQHLERFPGVAILTTNLPSNLDEAFRRRWFQHVVFEKPDAPARLGIWHQVLTRSDISVGNDLELAALARAFPLSGGSIRNAAVQALYLALADGVPVVGLHLLRGLVREYQKLGQELSEADVLRRLNEFGSDARGRVAS